MKLATLSYNDVQIVKGALSATRAHFAQRTNAITPQPSIGQTDDPDMSERPPVDWTAARAFEGMATMAKQLADELGTGIKTPTLIRCDEIPLANGIDEDLELDEPYLDVYLTTVAARMLIQGALNAGMHVALEEKPEGYRKRLALLERLSNA